MITCLEHLLSLAQSSPSFEALARAVLTACQARLSPMLRAGAQGAPRRLLRGLLHMRTDEAYLAMFVHAFNQSAPQDAAHVSSAAVWQWVRVHQCPLALDVELRQLSVDPLSAQPKRLELPGAPQDEGRDMSASLHRYLGRDATHILILPLCDVAGRLGGMLSLELEAFDAIGDPDLWAGVGAELRLIAMILGPYLIARATAREPAPLPAFDPLLPVVGPTMASLINLLDAFASQQETLLISGQSGTGKSRLARWCHARSPRSEGPFEILDLLSIPEEMQMAELVGWRRGAFTGAVHDVAGAVERASGGTLFIDEIDKLSLRTQAGLLQLLEEGTFRRLGDREGRRQADVRFIVGTNASLFQAVREGRFREDLYYRVNILPVQLPALEQRRDEIRDWAIFMLDRSAAMGRSAESPPAWSQDALTALQQQRWPGNLRQLDNVVRRAHIIASLRQRGQTRCVVERQDVTSALTLERAELDVEDSPRDASRSAASSLMRAAGRAFVELALRCQDLQEDPLSLDLADALRGYILQAAADRLDDRDEAFRLLGKSSLLKNRNHHRAWTRELERVQQLEQLEVQLAMRDGEDAS